MIVFPGRAAGLQKSLVAKDQPDGLAGYGIVLIQLRGPVKSKQLWKSPSFLGTSKYLVSWHPWHQASGIHQWGVKKARIRQSLSSPFHSSIHSPLVLLSSYMKNLISHQILRSKLRNGKGNLKCQLFLNLD